MRRLEGGHVEVEAGAGGSVARPSVLVIEDDEVFSRVLVGALGLDGYLVLEAPTGQRAVAEVRTRNPDVILLDLGLPDIDGTRLVLELRKHTTAPIIVVSGRDHETNKVGALDAGANDYVTKPFSISELRARIRVGLRRKSQIRDTAETSVVFGEFTLDLAARRLTRQERPVHLSATEFKLLATLARHADEAVTTNTLLKETWGSAYQNRSSYVRVYMHALRCKLERDPTRPLHLLNEIGVGYKLRTGLR